MRRTYIAVVEYAEGDTAAAILFPDFPEIASAAPSPDFPEEDPDAFGEATLYQQALDALETAVAARVEDNEDLPDPTPPWTIEKQFARPREDRHFLLGVTVEISDNSS